MSAVREMLYGNGNASAPGWTLPQQQGGSLVGAEFGANVGSQVFRVQLTIAGFFLAAVVVLALMHRAGHRFSVKVN